LTTAPPPFYGKFWSLLVNTLLLQLPIVVAATLLANADDAEQVTCKKSRQTIPKVRLSGDWAIEKLGRLN